MITLKYGSSVVSVPRSALEKLSEAGEAELRVLLCVCSGNTDPETVGALCGLDSLKVQNALSFWRGADVIEGSALQKKRHVTPADGAARVYTGDEISKICKDDGSVEVLIGKCREILGSRVFTHSEASSVIYLRQGLKLEPEYIILLCSHYAKRERISMRFIEKKALILYDEGIRSVSQLEAYLGGETKKHDVETLVRTLFGLGERSLVPREREYISNWVKWDISEDLIRRAYEETVPKTDRPTLAYANAIITNWHSAGVENGEQAEENKKKYKTKTGGKRSAKVSKSTDKTSFDLDEFFDLAIARGEKNNKSEK